MKKPEFKWITRLWQPVFIAGLMLPFFSCKKEEAVANNELVGRWNWVESHTWGKVSTPESTGKTKEILFEPVDSVRYYENGLLYKTWPYRFEYHKDEPTDTDSILVVVIRNTSFHFSVENDTLMMDANVNYFDLPYETYVRID